MLGGGRAWTERMEPPGRERGSKSNSNWGWGWWVAGCWEGLEREGEERLEEVGTEEEEESLRE